MYVPFCVLFVCKCALYYCHLPVNSNAVKYIISYNIISYHIKSPVVQSVALSVKKMSYHLYYVTIGRVWKWKDT
jgi:hypothetical protein